MLPVRKFGSKGEKQSFRAEWCEKYNWLHYDHVSDAAFCHLDMDVIGNKFVQGSEHHFCQLGKFTANS